MGHSWAPPSVVQPPPLQEAFLVLQEELPSLPLLVKKQGECGPSPSPAAREDLLLAWSDPCSCAALPSGSPSASGSHAVDPQLPQGASPLQEELPLPQLPEQKEGKHSIALPVAVGVL